MAESGIWERMVDGSEWYMGDSGIWQRVVDGIMVDGTEW